MVKYLSRSSNNKEIYYNTKHSNNRLPKDSVIILKHWFEYNIRYPYPSKHERDYLIETTGLTKEQIQNWLVNIRTRKWKSILSEQGIQIKSKKEMRQQVLQDEIKDNICNDSEIQDVICEEDYSIVNEQVDDCIFTCEENNDILDIPWLNLDD